MDDTGSLGVLLNLSYRYKIETTSLRLCSIGDQAIKTGPQRLIFNISFKSRNKVQSMALEKFSEIQCCFTAALFMTPTTQPFFLL